MMPNDQATLIAYRLTQAHYDFENLPARLKIPISLLDESDAVKEVKAVMG